MMLERLKLLGCFAAGMVFGAWFTYEVYVWRTD